MRKISLSPLASLSTSAFVVIVALFGFVGYTGINTAHADLSVISNQIIHGVTFTTDKSKGSYDIQFTINSGGIASNDFKYGIELVPLNGQSPDFTTIADEKVYSQTLSLGAGKSIDENISYTPPALNGTYRMMVETKNSSGLPLSSAFVTDITLNASQTQKAGITIDPKSCFLTVGSDATKYDLIQGVDILPTESLFLTCTASNISKTNAINGTVNFITDKRNTFGDTIANVPQKNENISLGAGQSKTFKIELPKPIAPQAYDTIVTISTGNPADSSNNSNPIIAHWVLAGESATIQNVSLDKSAYKPGNNVNVSFSWTGSANSFAGARNSATGTQTESYTAILQICDNSQSINLDPKTGSGQAQLAIPASCNNPYLTINILGGSTNLATWNMVIPMATSSASMQSGDMSSGLINFIQANIVLIIIILLLIVLLIIFGYMKKAGLITALLIVSGVSLLGGHTASAQNLNGTIYYLMTNSLDKNVAYYCTQNSTFLTNALSNALNNQTLFDGGQTLPILQQPVVVSQGNRWTQGGIAGTCITVTNNQNGNNPSSYSSNGVDQNGNIILQSSSKWSTINATGTPITFNESSQFSVVANNNISSFESQSDAAISASPNNPVGSQLTSNPSTTATITIPRIPLPQGAVFPFNSFSFVGRTLLYNGNTLVAKSPWTSINIWLNPPAGGIVELPGGSGTLQMTDPADGNLYAFSFAMTSSGPAYNPSTSFYPGDTIYLQNLLLDVVLYCTNGYKSNLSMTYQVHPQSVPLDTSGTWTPVVGNYTVLNNQVPTSGQGYLPTVNTPSAPLAPGDYYMDVKLTSPINLYHSYVDYSYQDGIVRIPFTIKYYQVSANSLIASPDTTCALNATASSTVGTILKWDNSVNQTSPFNSYIAQGYKMGYNVKRLKYGDTSTTTVTSLAPNQAFSSSTNQSYTFNDTGLSQSTTYQYWMEWVLSKGGQPTITLQDPSSVYAVTTQCGAVDPNIGANSCNISSNATGYQSPGTSTILTWSSNGYDTCKINSSNASSSGTMTVNPAATTNYILDCSLASSPTANHCLSNTRIDVTSATTSNSVINLSDILKCGAYDQSGHQVTSANQYQQLTWKVINSSGGLAGIASSWTFTGGGASVTSSTASEPTMSFSTTGKKMGTASVAGGSCTASVTISKNVLKEI